jgi:hypothetical protein
MIEIMRGPEMAPQTPQRSEPSRGTRDGPREPDSLTDSESIGAAWKEIATGFLKVGATAYGGPAIMGVMQAASCSSLPWRC